MPPFAQKGQQVLMTAVSAAHPRKAVVEVAAVQVAIDHLPDIRSWFDDISDQDEGGKRG
jgi:hypothetical protein